MTFVLGVVLALILLYFVGKYVILSVETVRFNRTPLGKAYKGIDDAEKRRRIARREMEDLSLTDPNRDRWLVLWERADEDVKQYQALIDEDKLRQEEERMIRGR